LSTKNKERTGYPVQKPEELLERIIKVSSNPGDLILDPFCGSGTTCVVAKKLGREYIGIDEKIDAVEISRRRIPKSLSEWE
jgi:site-specific DNA-methyltransferase (adenine-specific)